MPSLLNEQAVFIPLTKGVETKAHKYALELPSLAALENGYWPEPGSISKRPGHVALSSNIDGGGTLSNIKGLAVRDNELVCFANAKVYSWSPNSNEWMDRGDYEGVEVTSKDVVVRPSEQTFGDRARYASGSTDVTVYAWEDQTGSTVGVHLQVFDTVTGAALCAVQNLGSTTKRPRCLEIGGKLHVYYTAGTEIRLQVIDPTDVAGTVDDAALTPWTDPADSNVPFAVIRKNSTHALLAYRLSATHHNVYAIDSAGAITTSASKARVAAVDGPIALAYEPNTDRVLVLRDDETNLDGDLLVGSSLADDVVDTAIAAPVGTMYQMTAAFRETAQSAGVYRAVVFYSTLAFTSTVRVIKAYYFDTVAANGVVDGPSGAGNWAIHADLASHAFGKGASVYVVTTRIPTVAITTAKNGVYVMYRDDGHIIARFLHYTASRVYGGPEDTGYHLPQFESLGSSRYAFIATFKNRLGATWRDVFADRGLRDYTIDFASAKPYHGVQVGKSLYMTGGYVASYDGVSVVESGFFAFPDGTLNSASTATTGGSIAGATSPATVSYSYAWIWEWRNAQGEIERSSYTSLRTYTFSSATDTNTITTPVPTLPQTAKRSTARSDVVLVGYRTEKNPGPGAALYRVTSLDPAAAAGNNTYYVNDATTDLITFVDGMSDTTLITQEPFYLNSGEIDNVAPETASVIAQGQGRLYLAGLQNPDRIVYSKIWTESEAVAFNDALELLVPRDGGPVTALAHTDNGVFIFKQHRIYLATGPGPNNLGAGEYSDPQLLPSDTGCSDARTVTQTPMGIVFQSPKGFRLLTLNMQVVDIGGPVEDYKDQTFVSSLLLEGQNLILFVTSSGSTLAYDYILNQWATWTQPVGVAACLWQGLYVYAPTTSTVHTSSATKTDNDTPYTLAIQTPWIRPSVLQGLMRVRQMVLLGEYVASHKLRVRIGYDLKDAWVDDREWPVDTTLYQVSVPPKRERFQAFRLRIEDVEDVGTLADSFKAVALTLLVGFKPHLVRQPSARRV